MKDRVILFFKERFNSEKGRINALIVLGVTGMLLLGLSEWLPTGKSAKTQARTETQAAAPSQDAYAAQLETRLEALIEQSTGAGKTSVMVTMALSEETVYATDTESDNAGGRRSTHVLLDGTAQPALIESVAAPQVQGVAVVCQGGGNLSVQCRVTEIVSVLTGVGTNHITVTEMAGKEGQQ